MTVNIYSLWGGHKALSGCKEVLRPMGKETTKPLGDESWMCVCVCMHTCVWGGIAGTLLFS